MGVESLDILRKHRSNQIEKSPSSELFQIEGGSTFYGIFDDSHVEDNADDGHITQKKLNPRIIVSEIPSGLVSRSSKIFRENGADSYVFKFAGKDSEGLPILWLF